jgi:hypothetical protein
MNTIKKMRAGMIMFALAIVLVFTQSAFKSARAPQTWVFTGTLTSQITNPNFYSQTAPSPNDCDAGEPLPCKLVLDESINNRQALVSFMAGKSNDQILNTYAVGTRD